MLHMWRELYRVSILSINQKSVSPKPRIACGCSCLRPMRRPISSLGRSHEVDCSGGFALFETKNPAALCESAVIWADVLEIHNSPIVEDGDAGPILAKVFKK